MCPRSARGAPIPMQYCAGRRRRWPFSDSRRCSCCCLLGAGKKHLKTQTLRGRSLSEERPTNGFDPVRLHCPMNKSIKPFEKATSMFVGLERDGLGQEQNLHRLIPLHESNKLHCCTTKILANFIFCTFRNFSFAF